jgi:tyrosyl-tRNA synthetase
MFGKQPTIITDPEKIHDVLTRGVEDIFVKESLEKRLKSGQRLRIKLGIDPTGSTLHIGRAIPLRKLRAFQDLGHQIVFIVGDFTAQIGDASDKLQKRPMLTEAAVKENIKNYKKLVGKIIDIKKAEFVFNSSWLAKLNFRDVCELAETFTVQQMSNRRNFKDRFDKGEEVSLREFLYPLMQGYDSVMVNADVELGGFDQLFNLKAGRIIQKHFQKPEQDIIALQMLEGTDGRKMSTSWGNVINITDEPNDMYGKVMSVNDSLIIKYFTLCTSVSLSEIESLKTQLESGTNPRDIKMRLARELVEIYHSHEAALRAEKSFTMAFSEGGIPDDLVHVKVAADAKLVDVMVFQKIVASKSEWRRLIDERAVSIIETGEKIEDPYAFVQTGTYKIGKRRFLKLVTK